MISISNLAWPDEHDFTILPAVKSAGFSGVELAPLSIIDTWEKPNQERVGQYLQALSENRLTAYSLQSIFYGSEGAHLFKSDKSRSLMLDQLERVFFVAKMFGISNTVFGSPKLRTLEGMGEYEAGDIALDFFRKADHLAEQYDVVLALEPNPSIYGCEFLTSVGEVYDFLKRESFDNIKMNLDIGSVEINGDVEFLSSNISGYVSHVHISSTNLEPIYSHFDFHKKLTESIDFSFVSHACKSVEVLNKNRVFNIDELTRLYQIAQLYKG